jgi:hypothetical protein
MEQRAHADAVEGKSAGPARHLAERTSAWAIPLGLVTLAFWLLAAVVGVIATVVVKIVIGAALLAVRIGVFVCRNLFRTFPS